jgi:hypothetical protein
VDEDGYEVPVLDDEDVLGLCAAVVTLHRQAHSGEHPSVAMCHQEPCRSLSIAQLREVSL